MCTIINNIIIITTIFVFYMCMRAGRTDPIPTEPEADSERG